jgi:hypothetical protein
MTTIETVAELMVFAEKSGLGVHNMRKFIEQLLPDSPHLIYWDKMANGNYYKAEVLYYTLLIYERYIDCVLANGGGTQGSSLNFAYS